VVTLDDRWDQMNRSFMMPLTMSFAYLIDYGIIAGMENVDIIYITLAVV
jgi:hypothetical protein